MRRALKVCRTASRWNLVPAQKLLPLAPTSYCSGNILDILNNIEIFLIFFLLYPRKWDIAPSHCSGNKHPLIISRMTKFALPTKKPNILSVDSLSRRTFGKITSDMKNCWFGPAGSVIKIHFPSFPQPVEKYCPRELKNTSHRELKNTGATIFLRNSSFLFARGHIFCLTTHCDLAFLEANSEKAMLWMRTKTWLFDTYKKQHLSFTSFFCLSRSDNVVLSLSRGPSRKQVIGCYEIFYTGFKGPITITPRHFTLGWKLLKGEPVA